MPLNNGQYDRYRRPNDGCSCGCDDVSTCTWCGEDVLPADEQSENGDHLTCWKKEQDDASE